MIFLAYACLLLPGLAWWAWLGRRREDPLVSLGQITGISLALIILLAMAGFVLGVQFSSPLIVILLTLSALLAALGLVKKGIRIQRRYRLRLGIGLLVFALAIAWRLYQAQDLLLPNWVDSQHHFLIIRVILEGGGVPSDLSPYLQMPFYYHFGYHAVAALFTAISGLPIGQAMLSLGQVLNAMVGLSAYVLGKSLWHNWRPALAAALLISFATRMPAYYFSWGRYTLLVGLIFLPLAMALALDMTHRKTNIRDVLTLAILTASLMLTHYFAIFLLGIFIGLLAVVAMVRGTRRLPQSVLQISGMLNSAVFGLLLALPWFWRVAQYAYTTAGIEANLPESAGALFANERWRYTWQLLGPASNHWLLVPAVIGLVLMLIKRHNLGFALWSLVLVLLALPVGVKLGPFRSDHFTIVLFLPVTLLAGWLIWQGAQWIGRRFKQIWVSSLFLVLVVLGWAGWGFSSLRNVVNPTTVLVTEADLEALDWVADNTPPEARFYINTAYWLGNAYRGVDGGGWLLPYAGRWALIPTVFFGFSPDTARVSELNAWGQTASQITGCTAEFWSLVETAELDWLYLRAGVGSLQPAGLDGCEGIEKVYNNGSVFVYHINRK